VPSNALVTYQIELLSFKDPPTGPVLDSTLDDAGKDQCARAYISDVHL